MTPGHNESDGPLRERLLYAIVALTLTAVAFFTLRRDGYLAEGDVYPGYLMPGNHGIERSLALWGDIYNGVGSPQYAPGLLVPASWGWLWLHLGASGPTAQWLLDVALLLFIGLGTTFFARTFFPERRLIALAAGLSLPLSFYAASLVNGVTLWFALGFFPFSAALLLRRSREPAPWPRLAVEIGLLSLGLMVLVSTPPLAIYAVLWALAWLLIGSWRWRTWPRIWPGVVLGVVFAGALNGWWLYAAYLTLFASGGAAVQTFAGPLALSFVDRNAGILNMLSMQGTWTLPRLEYFPFDGRYLSGYRHFALYWPMIFAAVGLLFAPYRRRVWLLTAIVAISLFIGKGYHAPFGEVNAFLYDRLPFYWLFRDPQVETGMTLYLALFVLAGVGISQLVSLVQNAWDRLRASQRLRRPVVGLAGAVFVALLLSNGLVFVSGDLVPKTWLGGKATPIVTPPPYWTQAADYLDAQPDRLRVLQLPNDDFYAMLYDWGFYGSDLVARSLIARPVVNLSPGAFTYLAGPSSLRTQYAFLVNAIRSRSNAPIAPFLSSLGIGWLLQRNDIVWATDAHDILAPAQIADFLAHQPGIEKAASFGKLDIYRVAVPHGYTSAYDGVRLWTRTDLPDLLGIFDREKGEIPLLIGDATARQAPNTAASVRSLRSDSVARGWARYDATVDAAARVLVLHTTYSPGWQVEAGGAMLDWQHVAIDGYLNGWLIPPDSPVRVSVVYRPARLYVALQMLAAIGLCALLLALAFFAAPRHGTPGR